VGCLIVVALFAIVFFIWGPTLLVLGALFSAPWPWIAGIYFSYLGIKAIRENGKSGSTGMQRRKMTGRSGPKKPWMSMEDHYLESKRRRERKQKEEENG